MTDETGGAKPWAIVTNNCWGAGLYQERDLQYNTPFVGLYINADDYLPLLRDFRALLAQPIAFREGSRLGPRPHPVGLLGDVEIQFLHYHSEDEARRKWTDRAARLPPEDDDLFVKIDDRDGFTPAHLEAFAALPFKHKVAFLKAGRFDAQRHPCVVEIETPHGMMGSGIELWKATQGWAAFDAAGWVDRTFDPAAKRVKDVTTAS